VIEEECVILEGIGATLDPHPGDVAILEVVGAKIPDPDPVATGDN